MSEIKTDFARPHKHQRRQHRFSSLVALLAPPCLIMASAWWYSSATAQTLTTVVPRADIAMSQQQDSARHGPGAKADATTLKTTLRFEPGLLLTRTANLLHASDGAAFDDSRNRWIRIDVAKGDTLSSMFAQHDLSYADALAIARLSKYGNYFTNNLHVGDSFRVKVDGQGHVLTLKHAISPARTLEVQAAASGYSARIRKIELNKRIAYATGVINSSFYNDALASGLTPNQVMALASLFQWEVDFAYGVRPGDRFTVVYSELYKDGDKVANGHILAASFHTSEQLFRALRFTGYDNETMYYQPDGSSLKRAFIRTPVDYTRVSSPFTMAREHPILDTVRAHEGTDYAAPMGTPVHVAGDGRIKFRGRNGGYGNMVEVRHGNGITTRYGHMSRFASDQAVGDYVEQGEVIGYVGSTGLSTGPHLHYEFRVNGVPKNPQTVDLPGAPPLPDEYMDEFKTHVKPLIARLEAASADTLASNVHSDIEQ